MIRFFVFYFFVIFYRVGRMLVREKIDGDNNYLSSPILTMHRVMSDPIVKSKTTFVDVGCGEGLIALFMRLIHKKNVICCDVQTHYLRMISFLSNCLFISRVNFQNALPFINHSDVVFLCVWTSWSTKNRRRMIELFLTHLPKDGILITVSHGIEHSNFLELKTTVEPFAWGPASVYFYRHT